MVLHMDDVGGIPEETIVRVEALNRWIADVLQGNCIVYDRSNMLDPDHMQLHVNSEGDRVYMVLRSPEQLAEELTLPLHGTCREICCFLKRYLEDQGMVDSAEVLGCFQEQPHYGLGVTIGDLYLFVDIGHYDVDFAVAANRGPQATQSHLNGRVYQGWRTPTRNYLTISQPDVRFRFHPLTREVDEEVLRTGFASLAPYPNPIYATERVPVNGRGQFKHHYHMCNGVGVEWWRQVVRIMRDQPELFHVLYRGEEIPEETTLIWRPEMVNYIQQFQEGLRARLSENRVVS